VERVIRLADALEQRIAWPETDLIHTLTESEKVANGWLEPFIELCRLPPLDRGAVHALASFELSGRLWAIWARLRAIGGRSGIWPRTFYVQTFGRDWTFVRPGRFSRQRDADPKSGFSDVIDYS
jgi:hypothetical protein